MKKEQTILSIIKDEKLKKQIRAVTIEDSFYFAHGAQKNQSERRRAWIGVLAAINQKIPVVFFGSNPTEKYKKYVKKVCSNLKPEPDTAVVLFTSGSTGKPKPIQRSEKQLLIKEGYQGSSMGITKDTVIADFRGLNHESGLGQFLRAAIAGCPFVFIDSTQDYFHIVEDCIKKGVTYLDVTAMQWHGIARALEDNDLKWNLKVAVATSGMIDKESIRILTERTPCKIFCVYTMTEVGIVAMIGPDMLLKKYGSVGKPVQGIAIETINEFGKKCIPFEEGEIVLKSRFVSYPNTSPYFSGDNGYFDEDGYLYLTGRKGDVLKIKGRRVNAMQIENAYKKYQSVVFGIPVAIMGGHEGVIVVETNDTLKQVTEYIKKTEPPVSEVCRPRWIFVSKKLPKTISGKFDRVRIKKEYAKKVEELKNKKSGKNGSDIEYLVTKIFEKTLCIKGVQTDDSFFDLGGKSLRVLTLISAVRREFGAELIPEQIYKNSTAKKLSKIICRLMR